MMLRSSGQVLETGRGPTARGGLAAAHQVLLQLVEHRVLSHEA
eukprot:CAMPEP_0202088776 /NCGR_PEP_ID=MMETSP0964-20121228/39478_1 /ASSEMBLY_ACC=CAM_ASM_000500 /TAXON_ID=4773 /ORGANISM="Schizochytrium aggregatum, Strain ATCC28209" /LENGTH=42 /DNA_ID= /DNA_START= /DNA_END= /DNA_ORIENTATION=